MKKNQKFVLILGMHRSGTSLITNILSEAGFYIGEGDELLKGDFWNRNGYFERRQIYLLNESIIRESGGNWHEPPEEKRIIAINRDQEIRSALKPYKNHQKSVLKDPRICLTFPLWEPYIKDNLHIIFIMRHRSSVVSSLMVRDKFSKEKSNNLWKTYNKRALRYIEKYPHFKLRYESFFSHELDVNMNELAIFLGIETDLKRIAYKIVDSRLQHHKKESKKSVNKNIDDIKIIRKYEIAGQFTKMGRIDEAIHVLKGIIEIDQNESFAQDSIVTLKRIKSNASKKNLTAAKNHLIKDSEIYGDPEKSPGIDPKKIDKKNNSVSIMIAQGEDVKTKIQPWWNYPRFKNPNVKVLLVSVEHLLMFEIKNALERNGHECKFLLLNGKEFERDKILNLYKKAIKSAQPDFVLTVNHLGFDKEGMVTALLNKLSLPFASWYVDSPHLILNHYADNLSPYLTIFLWDEDYIDIVRNLGFGSVKYLPLGTDDYIFRTLNRNSRKMGKLTNDIIFVGNSMVLKTRSKLNKCMVNGNLKKYFYDVSKAYLESDYLIVREMLQADFPDLYTEIIKYPDVDALGYETAVTWYATLKYRERLIKKIGKFRPLIIGDKGWHELLGEEFIIKKEINYYNELPAIYEASKICFNATSRQMKQGVNQRVFDVPACLGVGINDWTRQLENLMEPGKETLAYKNEEEIPFLVEQLLNDHALRNRVRDAGYRRVKMHHTYSHRLEKLVQVMRERYK